MDTVPVARLTAPAVVGRRLSEGLGRNHCCPKQVLALGFAPLEPSFPLWRPICSRIRAIRSRRTVLDSIFEVPSNRFGPQTQSDTGIDGPPRRWSHPQRSWTAPFWLGRRHDLRPGLLERLGAYEARPPPTASTAVLDGNGPQRRVYP
jgi:hypothetical protein